MTAANPESTSRYQAWSPDERSGMIIVENVAGPEMINTILLSHLLFINSLSAIMARPEMKGEGRGERSTRHCRFKKKARTNRGRGSQERVLISAAVIYILIKSAFGSWR